MKKCKRNFLLELATSYAAAALLRQKVVVDREGHRQLPRRVVELVLEGALARLVLGLDRLALVLVGGDRELARKLRLERPVARRNAG